MHIWRGPNVWHLDRLLSVPQIDLSAHADRKNGHFLCLSVLFHKEIMIMQNRYADKKKIGVRRKTFTHRPMHNCISVYFIKKSQPKFQVLRDREHLFLLELSERKKNRRELLGRTPHHLPANIYGFSGKKKNSKFFFPPPRNKTSHVLICSVNLVFHSI
jgi:hypothetical protein